MKVVVLGANGKVGRRVVAGLVADGHDVTGMVRRADQVPDVEAAGARAAIGDLLEDVTELLTGAETVVFAAGAPFAGDPDAIDGDACIAAQRSAVTAGVQRWVQVSSLMADRPDDGPPVLHGFLRAKQRSDDALPGTGLAWTVVRPSGLLDSEPTGLVEVGTGLGSAPVSRADVAAVVVATVTSEHAIGRGFDLIGGDTPIEDALRGL